MNKLIIAIILNLLIVVTTHSQNKDCNDPLILCGEPPFRVQTAAGEGELDSEVSNTCLSREFNSTWIELNIVESGLLIFEIIPDTVMYSDLDFALFQITDDCESKVLLRCMASGITSGNSDEENLPCLGSTGLAIGETDIEETAGCTEGDNNFLAPVEVLEGEKYMLLVNDFSYSGLFDINFLGSAKLDCILTGNENIVVKDASPLFSFDQRNDQINVSTTAFDGQATLFVYAMNGSKVFEQNTFQNETLSINKLNAGGVYFVVLKTMETIQTEKVVVVF